MQNIYTKKYAKKTNELAGKLKKNYPDKSKIVEDWQKETIEQLGNNKNWLMPPDTPRSFEIILLCAGLGILIAVLLQSLFLAVICIFVLIGCLLFAYPKPKQYEK